MHMSSETYNINFELIGIGNVQANIMRILSPLTIQRFISKIPMSALGRFFIGGRDYFMIPIGVKKGLEKQINSVSKGDIVYEADSDSLMVCLVDGTTKMNVSKMGIITGGLELFEKIKRSNSVKISKL